jgi:hypothetical protein
VLGVAIAIAILGDTAAAEQSNAFEHCYAILILGGILTGLFSAPLSPVKQVPVVAVPAAAPALDV